MPANAALVNEQLIEFAFFDILPTDLIDEKLFYLPDEEPYNMAFQMFGFESRLFIGNASFILWVVQGHVLLILIYYIAYKVNCLRTRLAKYLFWNNLIRLFSEIFFELVLLAALNLHTSDWGSPFKAVTYSNVLAVIFIVLTCTIPILIVGMYFRNRLDWNENVFQAKYGALLDGTKTSSRILPSSIPLLYVALYFTRRAIFVLAVFLLADYLVV